MPAERLFFALWPSAEVHHALQQISHQLPPLSGRLMPPETWHITLAFLGDIETAQQPALVTAATHINSPAFSLTLTRFGHWPQPGILWLGPKTTPPLLQRLVNELNHALAPTGYRPEARPYRPHVTLMRNVSSVENTLLPTVTPIVWPVTHFCLVRSMPTQGRTQYAILHQWALPKKQPFSEEKTG